MKAPHVPLTLGLRPLKEGCKKGVCFAFPVEGKMADQEQCGVIFYDNKTDKCLKKHVIPVENRIGNVVYDTVEEMDNRNISYLFFQGEKLIPDKYAKAYKVQGKYGDRKAAADYKACLYNHDYDWDDSVRPEISYENCIMYCLHVRGFTKHISSGVRAKGTFAGIVEKLSYLKDLGITTLELQPCYEFDEMCNCVGDQNTSVINYWGYQEGYYYAPKQAYSYKKDAGKEFKDMIKACHNNGMEVILQFYFPTSVDRAQIRDILRYWSHYYQVDGFHLKGRDLPIKDIATDPYLAQLKLMYEDFPVHAIYQGSRQPSLRRLAVYHDGFMVAMRRFLKGESGMIQEAMCRSRHNPLYTGIINYMSNYYGLNMMDMVSYNEKHNEKNGEDGRDGWKENFSWNCGTEGWTKKESVLRLRDKQLKNAFLLLLLSQGTPLLFMGDEFGNSQMGNNNPYCQDNATCWLNWRDLQRNENLYSFVKNMIAFRKKYEIFHLSEECTLTDYKYCGYPDISYHNDQAWKPTLEMESHHIAFMLCGDYGAGCEGTCWYVAMNMDGDKQAFAMPEGINWELYLHTDSETPVEDAKKNLLVASRSIAIYRGTITKKLNTI